MDFLQKLAAGGFIRLLSRSEARVGAFVVTKKDGRQRLVVDCRAANRRFRPTPHLPMGTGAAWSELVLQPEQPFFIALSDIKDYFYCLAIPDDLCEFFAFEPITGPEAAALAREFPALGNPADFENLEQVFPCLQVLPMGWSWSFHFAQVALSHSVKNILDLPSGNLILDREPLSEPGDTQALVLPYCDNLSFGSSAQATADGARVRTSDAHREMGFKVHDETEASLWASSLGFAIDGLAGRFSPTPERAWKVKRALEALARRPVVSGSQVERILGHTTFLFFGETGPPQCVLVAVCVREEVLPHPQAALEIGGPRVPCRREPGALQLLRLPTHLASTGMHDRRESSGVRSRCRRVRAIVGARGREVQ